VRLFDSHPGSKSFDLYSVSKRYTTPGLNTFRESQSGAAPNAQAKHGTPVSGRASEKVAAEMYFCPGRMKRAALGCRMLIESFADVPLIFV